MELITIRSKCKGLIVNGRVTDNTLREALAGTDILQKYSCKQVRARTAFERRLLLNKRGTKKVECTSLISVLFHSSFRKVTFTKLELLTQHLFFFVFIIFVALYYSW